ncbi:MAG: hypothetical protein KatS3mg003_1947 [Candidatus Nitrosocaldaceae archaeon]|nr:MAG: hypothetical protein KatS3mg003_1594 [Candidatus Nitrosocaldaceae archaeon]GIU72468.1 MAG: hypothetical protein KatS3mg003_1947 [Candidatus Nitrosocaldaceae archaeon]
MFEGEIQLILDEKEAIYKALKPDVLNDKDASIVKDEQIKIIINAEKISDLRAKVNSYLRLIEVAINALKIE